MAIFIPTGSMADAKWLTQIRRPSPRKGISTIGPLWKIYQRGAIGSWTDTSHALNECAALIIGARGRLRVYFFISPTSKEDISGVAELQDLYLFRSRGDTPTYQRLKRQLDEFVEAFASRNGSQREAYPGLNLVIFTDEAPEELLEDIEEVIGDMAKELDSLEAEKYKVGIQFVQIENDGSVTNFFERIDNVIKGEYGLRRDTVDTTRYDRATADENIYKKHDSWRFRQRAGWQSISSLTTFGTSQPRPRGGSYLA